MSEKWERFNQVLWQMSANWCGKTKYEIDVSQLPGAMVAVKKKLDTVEDNLANDGHAQKRKIKEKGKKCDEVAES